MLYLNHHILLTVMAIITLNKNIIQNNSFLAILIGLKNYIKIENYQVYNGIKPYIWFQNIVFS